MSEKLKKKIPGYYLVLVAFICILTFFFTSISTILSKYINYRTSSYTSGIKIIGNIDNYISDIDNKTLIVSIDRYLGDEYQRSYLNTFDPESKKNNQVLIDELIFNPTHDFKSYIVGSYKNLIWIFNKGLNAYNINDLKKIYSNNDIFQHDPFLKKILEKSSTKYKLLKNVIYINDEQNVYSLNLDTLTGKIDKNINLDLLNHKPVLFDTSPNLYLPLNNLKNVEISLKGKIDKKLYLRENNEGSYFEQKIKTNLSFSNAKLLIDTTTNKLLESNPENSIVVIHDDKMTNQGKHFTISVVSLEGVLQWIMFQSDLGLNPNNSNSKVIIDSAHLNSKKQLIMLTINPEAAFAFDMKNGSIIWRY